MLFKVLCAMSDFEKSGEIGVICFLPMLFRMNLCLQ